MMRNLLRRLPLVIILSVACTLTLNASAQSDESTSDAGAARMPARTTRRSTTTRSSSPANSKTTKNRAGSGTPKDSNLARAMKLAADGRYQDASKLLFQMSRSPQYQKDSAQIKYILGLMLFEMKMNQAAAFVFYDVIRQESHDNPKSKYLRQSLEKLVVAGDALDSDVLLRYAIKQVSEDEFPAANRDMLSFRTGEVKLGEKNYIEAAKEFNRVRSNSLFYQRARYKLGLALTEAGQLEKAQAVFEDLAEKTKGAGITDGNRVNALLGRARVLYQRKDFSSAVEAYREIPRDTEQWHNALFESTWANLRDGRFRSALSNFHSLHSTFYEDVYQPESLMLRAIVYLYICRYDELEKVVNLFERVYKPVQRDVGNMLATVSDPLTYYRELAKTSENYEALRLNRINRKGFQLPFIVSREVLKEGDVRHTFNYIHNLDDERKRIETMPSGWKTSGVGQYAKKIIEKRVEATRVFAGRQVQRHLTLIQNELKDLFEQSGFLRFEMLSGKKESLRKEIAGKEVAKSRVDQDSARNFYIQNGYEYWPFKGEYWLDEIGNYHYVGVKACE